MTKEARQESLMPVANLTLYHLTSSVSLNSILAGGLDPDRSREPPFRRRHVYFSQDLGHAIAYAGHHEDWEGDAVLLAVSIADLDLGLLGPDDVDLPDLMASVSGSEDWATVPWMESLSISGQCTYAGIVPPDAIRVVSVLPVPQGEPGKRLP
jgi:hypothetical protein